MKPLRDSEARTPLMQKAQALIDAVEPVPESPERMSRIRRELDRTRGSSAVRLPAFALAALVVLFGASAFAAVRLYVAAAATRSAAARSAAERKVGHASSRRAHPAVQNSVPTAVPPSETLTAPETPSSTVVQDALPARAAPAPRTAARVTTGRDESHARPPAHETSEAQAAASAAAAAIDSELVHRAVQALRHDRDPVLAARLLAAHRARSPSGPLAEEVLSLQIEAAMLLHEPSALTFAREYLARYPNGRYRDIAERASRVPSP